MILLASTSPARRRLLESAGVVVETRPAAVDEAALRAAMALDDIRTVDAATHLAELKAMRVSASVRDDRMVLAADQLLEFEGNWLGKAENRGAAFDQLKSLAGKTHKLVTAAVIFKNGSRIWHVATTAEISLHAMDDAEINRYLDDAGDEILGSVGCYHIEGLGARLIRQYRGDLFSIQGLPLIEVLSMLREHHVFEDAGSNT